MSDETRTKLGSDERVASRIRRLKNKLKKAKQGGDNRTDRLTVLYGKREALVSDLQNKSSVNKRIEWLNSKIDKLLEELGHYNRFLINEKVKLCETGKMKLRQKLEHVNKQIREIENEECTVSQDDLDKFNRELQNIERLRGER